VYSPKLKREINPMNEICVTAGANGALNSFIAGFCNKGDNIVIFEPCFPPYIDHSILAGCEVKSVPLVFDKPKNDWIFDPE